MSIGTATIHGSDFQVHPRSDFAILTVNHVVTKFTHIGATGKDIRKLAKSRIVLLQVLFASEEPYRLGTVSTTKYTMYDVPEELS